MQAYLQPTEVIDWLHPAILQLAGELSAGQTEPTTIAKLCFEWVRDRINHSVDYQRNPVTWRASAVLQHQTGYCFAKSHLLAALLRANDIPAGFCYQRLSIDDKGAPYSLHGFNAVYLPEFGWYRVDPRGNKPGINAQFDPPHESLAYPVRIPGEAEFEPIFAEPLSIVITALQTATTWEEALNQLPDVSLEQAEDFSLVPRVKVPHNQHETAR